MKFGKINLIKLNGVKIQGEEKLSKMNKKKILDQFI